jgi:hypothetical protein
VTINGVYYDNVYGYRIPGPIWKQTMQNTLKGMGIPPAAFADPPKESLIGRPVEVPDVVGLPPEEAIRILEGEGFNVTVSPGREFSDVPKGAVARTSPAGGAEVPSGTTVTIFISGGRQQGDGCPPRQTACPPGPG